MRVSRSMGWVLSITLLATKPRRREPLLQPWQPELHDHAGKCQGAVREQRPQHEIVHHVCARPATTEGGRGHDPATRERAASTEAETGRRDQLLRNVGS